MAALAGETIIAGKVPGGRVATAVRTVNSPNVTDDTETEIDSVTASVVAGRTYLITWAGRPNANTVSNDIQLEIREDSVSGAVLTTVVQDIPVVSRGPRIHIVVEYTADATENKTFVMAINMFAGSGNVSCNAAATQPTYLYVDYIRG